MKALVNEACIGCGLCTNLCPAVFSMTQEGVAHADPADVPKEQQDATMDAASSCPVSAIELD